MKEQENYNMKTLIERGLVKHFKSNKTKLKETNTGNLQ